MAAFWGGHLLCAGWLFDCVHNHVAGFGTKADMAAAGPHLMGFRRRVKLLETR